MEDSKTQEFTKTRKEFAARYFLMIPSAYEEGNMGLITVLSDLQETLSRVAQGEALDERVHEHYRRALNDIKSVLSEDWRQEREAEGRAR